MAKILEVINISKSYNNHSVVENISFCLLTGEILGIAGHSGSGKSTLLRIIAGLEPSSSGEVHKYGKISMMFQDFQLFPHMTVLENLTYAANHIMKNNKHKHAEYALDLLKTLGIETKYNTFPSKLSGGQKQRVALARSIMMKPSVLLCDEPTSGLDVTRIDDVASLLRKTQKEQDLSIIVTSHDLKFLSQISDNIIIIKDKEVSFYNLENQSRDFREILKSKY